MHGKDRKLMNKNKQRRKELEKLNDSLGMTGGPALAEFVRKYEHIETTMTKLQINLSTLKSSLEKGFMAIVDNKDIKRLIGGENNQSVILHGFIAAIAGIMPILAEYYKHPIENAETKINSIGDNSDSTLAIGSGGNPGAITSG
eukprot:TRINITY_DN638_c0_g1_i1.p1 TRINITY_DN638_c0_g1~~TRINITY_DN638_c0_g1_i1.p1  ORF type:complete len:144 (+),score=23.68 TRINITY_DN638_c0_g1_i1:577-1008(+)